LSRRVFFAPGILDARRARLSARLEAEPLLDRVEARGLRLQDSFEVVNPLDKIFEQLARGGLSGHKFSERLRGGGALSFTPNGTPSMIVQTAAQGHFGRMKAEG
jgi:hypothetical protein